MILAASSSSKNEAFDEEDTASSISDSEIIEYSKFRDGDSELFHYNKNYIH